MHRLNAVLEVFILSEGRQQRRRDRSVGVRRNYPSIVVAIIDLDSTLVVLLKAWRGLAAQGSVVAYLFSHFHHSPFKSYNFHYSILASRPIAVDRAQELQSSHYSSVGSIHRH